ncbi:MAG: hypothetical protein WBG50_25490 [Desulfomonilaceae bacterium]
MINLLTIASILMMLIIPPCAACEEQVTDSTGRVVDIKQRSGDTSYAYDGNRHAIYTATSIKGGKGALDFRDHYGVHVGVSVPGTAQELHHKWGRGLFSPNQNQTQP